MKVVCRQESNIEYAIGIKIPCPELCWKTSIKKFNRAYYDILMIYQDEEVAKKQAEIMSKKFDRVRILEYYENHII